MRESKNKRARMKKTTEKKELIERHGAEISRQFFPLINYIILFTLYYIYILNISQTVFRHN